MGVFARLFGRAAPAAVQAPQHVPVDLDGDGMQSRAEDAGSFRGKHFTEWAPIVDRLRADGRLDESLALAFECIDATERESAVDGSSPAPGYYEDAAMVLRKLKRYAEEVEVLDRYLRQGMGRHPKFEDRRRKAAALRDAETQATPLACPTCGTVLEHPPKARGKCPSCASPLVVRTVDGQRVAFTPEQAAAQAVAEKAAKQRARYLLRLGYFDVTEGDWDRTHAEQAARFGHESADADVYWQLANERAVAYEAEQNWLVALRVRNDMAKHLVEEGRDWFQAAQLAERDTMRALQQFDGPHAAMILIACACDACQRDHLLARSLGEFAVSSPVPHHDCQRPPCKCRITRRTH